MINQHKGIKNTQLEFEEGKFRISLQVGDNRQLKLNLQQWKKFNQEGKIYIHNKYIEKLIENGIMSDNKVVQLRLTNNINGVVILCGVEFYFQEQDCIFVPRWMQEYLNVQIDSQLFIKSIQLQKINYLKLKPENKLFFQIDNYLDKLEKQIQGFSALVINQWIQLQLDNTEFWVQVIELKPDFGSLIDTEVEIEFAAIDEVTTIKEMIKGLNQQDFVYQNLPIKQSDLDLQCETKSKKAFSQNTFNGVGRKL